MSDPLPWIALRRADGLTRRRAWRLIEAFGSPEAVLRAPRGRLAAFVSQRAARALAAGGARAGAEAAIARAGRAGLRCLVPPQPQFPERLRHIPDPPLALYARGPLPSGPALAVVGSRRASQRSRALAQAWCAALARAGATIVSGLAYGVDAAAHRGALQGEGPTVAVLASGLDRPSPQGNRRLAERILEAGGAWLSEHPPGTPALPHHFPERNRLISGLSDQTLIVEARERSGSLWTALHALEQGRDVLTVPGPVDTELCRGSNRLLRDGAAPMLDADDLCFAVLGFVPAAPGPSEAETDALLGSLRAGPRDVEDLLQVLGLGAGELAARLLDLELAGRISVQGSRVAAATPPRRR